MVLVYYLAKSSRYILILMTCVFGMIAAGG